MSLVFSVLSEIKVLCQSYCHFFIGHFQTCFSKILIYVVGPYLLEFPQSTLFLVYHTNLLLKYQQMKMFCLNTVL